MSLLRETERNTISLITIMSILALFFGYLFLKYQFNISIDNQIEKNYKSVEELFHSNIKHEKEKFNLELKTMVSLPNLSKFVQENDYIQINRLITKYYSNLLKIYPDIKILTFRNADGITIYRAHKPEFYGDKVSENRKLIIDTNKYEKSLSGFEVGKLAVTYRITYPIFHNKKYVGNVEIGLDPTHFLNELNTVFDIHTAILVKKSLLGIMIKSTSISIDENYELFNADKKLQLHFIKHHEEKVNFLYNEDPLKVKDDISLLNHKSETLGYLVVAFDKEEMINNNNKFVYRFFGFIILMMIVVSFILYKGFKKILDFFKQQIYTDQLTGLKNREALNELLYKKKNHVLILSDIKDFSIINELYGVEVGNDVLKHIGIAFEKFANENLFHVFRIASDEYVLYKEEDFFDADYYDDTLEMLHKQINFLEISVNDIVDTIKVDINSGIVFDNVASLEKVQMALKKTKSTTSSYVAYSKEIDTKEKAESIIKIKSSISKGLREKNVIPFFQGITDNQGKIIKYEALIRIIEYKDGLKSIIPPDSFLPISKKSGFYTQISQIMIESSLTFFKDKDEKISINVSPDDLFNSDIMDTLIENIKLYDDPSKIIVEITEQDNIESFDRFIHGIHMLRRLGVMVAIDDFGSGYANYAHILVIKPDYLKIDGSLVSKIIEDKDIQILVRSIISFAKELKIKTIAEYIENKEIFELLKEYGADEFQGYYFSKPTDLINQDK